MEEKILTRHPQGKRGVNISKAKYDGIRQAIIEALSGGERTYSELLQEISARLDGKFDGSIAWYTESVKLDLEARGIIERVPKTKPQKLRPVE